MLAKVSFPVLSTVSDFSCDFNASLSSISFPALTTFTASKFQARTNANPNTEINSLLTTFVSLGNTPLNVIVIDGQNPIAPSTGQGVIDKNLLLSLGKVVSTD